MVNQLSCDHEIEYGKKTGDFRVNGKYTLEVGGEGKTYDQIADVPDSYILADGIETPTGVSCRFGLLVFYIRSAPSDAYSIFISHILIDFG